MKTKNDRAIIFRRKIKILLYGLYNYGRELWQYLRHSNVDYYYTESNLIAIIVLSYHVIEKGLTMPDFRYGFGQPRLLQLIGDLEQYERLGFSQENTQYLHAVGVVKEYEQVHAGHYTFDATTEQTIKQFVQTHTDISCTEQIKTSAEAYFAAAHADFMHFANSRHSVRNFSSQDVPMADIRKAVELANNTPTPCNRQPNHCYVVENKEALQEILELQGGNRGFGHLGNKLLIVTTDMGVFAGVREHNETYKSGGMYAMNLLYALHYYHIAACTLQWGTQVKQEKRLRQITHIPEREQVIMMFLIGYPAEQFKLTTSHRTPANLTII